MMCQWYKVEMENDIEHNDGMRLSRPTTQVDGLSDLHNYPICTTIRVVQLSDL